MKKILLLCCMAPYIGILFLSCAINPKAKDIISLQYPVVLVHGIVFNDRSKYVSSWGRIPETLEKAGARVYYGNTDAWGDYESNATILKETIERVLAENNAKKVNIIAHSKGGLDARYLVWRYDFGDKVASLTTVCTPHRGSSIADLVLEHEIIRTKTALKALEIYGQLSGDVNPDLYDVGYLLTRDEMEAFNKEVIMDRRVYFQSLYTTMNGAFDDALFFNSYLYISKAEGKNDGLVSEASARWGGNSKSIGRGISHTEIIDLKQKRISGINIPALYVEIIRDLYYRGF